MCWYGYPADVCRTSYHLGLSRKLYYWFAWKSCTEAETNELNLSWYWCSKRILLEGPSIPLPLSHLVFHSIFTSEDYDLQSGQCNCFSLKVRLLFTLSAVCLMQMWRAENNQSLFLSVSVLFSGNIIILFI